MYELRYTIKKDVKAKLIVIIITIVALIAVGTVFYLKNSYGKVSQMATNHIVENSCEPTMIEYVYEENMDYDNNDDYLLENETTCTASSNLVSDPTPKLISNNDMYIAKIYFNKIKNMKVLRSYSPNITSNPDNIIDYPVEEF